MYLANSPAPNLRRFATNVFLIMAQLDIGSKFRFSKSGTSIVMIVSDWHPIVFSIRTILSKRMRSSLNERTDRGRSWNQNLTNCDHIAFLKAQQIVSERIDQQNFVSKPIKEIPRSATCSTGFCNRILDSETQHKVWTCS